MLTRKKDKQKNLNQTTRYRVVNLGSYWRATKTHAKGAYFGFAACVFFYAKTPDFGCLPFSCDMTLAPTEFIFLIFSPFLSRPQ